MRSRDLDVDRSHDPGRQAEDERSRGHVDPFEYERAAPMTDPRPIRAPFKRTAPIPIRQSSSMVQPCRITRWPTVTRLPTEHGMPGSAWIIDRSWMLVASPIVMRSVSPRRTELYQTLESLPDLDVAEDDGSLSDKGGRIDHPSLPYLEPAVDTFSGPCTAGLLNDAGSDAVVRATLGNQSSQTRPEKDRSGPDTIRDPIAI